MNKGYLFIVFLNIYFARAETFEVSEGENHTMVEVRSGDTLQKISLKYFNTNHRWLEILAANSDQKIEVTKLVPGMKLRIPIATGPAERKKTVQQGNKKNEDQANEGTLQRTIKVAKGDTLATLATRYYNDPIRWRDILKWNADRILSPESISVGTELRLIPPFNDSPNEGRVVSGMSVEAKSVVPDEAENESKPDRLIFEEEFHF